MLGNVRTTRRCVFVGAGDVVLLCVHGPPEHGRARRCVAPSRRAGVVGLLSNWQHGECARSTRGVEVGAELHERVEESGAEGVDETVTQGAGEEEEEEEA